MDPYAPMYASHTTYNYAVNNPVMVNDPSGGYAYANAAADRLYKINNPSAYTQQWADDFRNYVDYVNDLQDFKNGLPVSIDRGSFGVIIDAAIRGDLSISGMSITVGYSNRIEYVGLSTSDMKKYNIPSSMDMGIVTSPIKMSIESIMARNQERRDLDQRIKDEIGETFFGVPIIDSSIGDLKYGAAVTTPGAIRFDFSIWLRQNKKDPNAIRDLLRHEYGHILQYNRYGKAFFLVVAPVSAYSARYASDHMTTWTEAEANTLSYIFFQCPSDWNFTDYPIDRDFFNALVISSNQKKR